MAFIWTQKMRLARSWALPPRAPFVLHPEYSKDLVVCWHAGLGGGTIEGLFQNLIKQYPATGSRVDGSVVRGYRGAKAWQSAWRDDGIIQYVYDAFQVDRVTTLAMAQHGTGSASGQNQRIAWFTKTASPYNSSCDLSLGSGDDILYTSLTANSGRNVLKDNEVVGTAMKQYVSRYDGAEAIFRRKTVDDGSTYETSASNTGPIVYTDANGFYINNYTNNSSANQSFAGDLYLVYRYNRAIPDAWIDKFYANPYFVLEPYGDKTYFTPFSTRVRAVPMPRVL